MKKALFLSLVMLISTSGAFAATHHHKKHAHHHAKHHVTKHHTKTPKM